MSAIAFALILLASSRVLLVDDVYTIPASEWRYLEVGLNKQTATVECEFRVVEGGSGVRLALVSRPDLERFRARRSHDVLATTAFLKSGRLRFSVPHPGEYAIVVDNRMEGRGPARVDLKIYLDFSVSGAQQARELPVERRRFIVIVSILAFLATAAYASWRIWPALKTRS
jgi:hypothetical protein